MTFEQLAAYVGSNKQIDIANAFGKTKGTISLWNKNGIPPSAQYEIEHVTKGKLKADKKAA